MAGNMKAIKNRIKSVENTKQITKAMELVAASKLKKASAKIENSRPFFEILKETLDGIAKKQQRFFVSFLRARRVKAGLPYRYRRRQGACGRI